MPVSAVKVAVIILLVVILIYMVACVGARVSKDKFVSPQAMAVYQKAGSLFKATGGRPTFSEYKIHVPEADPVQYTDLRELWKKGKFTPEGVQSSL
jgi:hypothetical protein